MRWDMPWQRVSAERARKKEQAEWRRSSQRRRATVRARRVYLSCFYRLTKTAGPGRGLILRWGKKRISQDAETSEKGREKAAAKEVKGRRDRLVAGPALLQQPIGDQSSEIRGCSHNVYRSLHRAISRSVLLARVTF